MSNPQESTETTKFPFYHRACPAAFKQMAAMNMCAALNPTTAAWKRAASSIFRADTGEVTFYVAWTHLTTWLKKWAWEPTTDGLQFQLHH